MAIKLFLHQACFETLQKDKFYYSASIEFHKSKIMNIITLDGLRFRT